MATKKPTVKKTKKVTKKKAVKHPTLDATEILTRVQEAKLNDATPAVLDSKRAAILERIKLALNEGAGQSTSHARTRFGSLAEQRRNLLPWPDIAQQYLFGSFGLEYPGVIELIGDAGTGKSTMAIRMAGAAMLHLKAEVLLIDCENKFVSPDRARRALSSNPEIADKLHARITLAQAFSLTQMEDVLNDWVTQVRKSGLPRHIPVFVIVDPWSALMSDKEAEVAFQYKNVQKQKAKLNVTGEGSNLRHAQWAHAKGRKLPQFISANNVILLLVNHQTVHIDMSPGKPMPTPEWVKQVNNASALGGRAWKQRALLTLVVANVGIVLDASRQPIGSHLKFRVHKYSYGPSWRIIDALFRTRHDGRDKEKYLDPAFHFDFFCRQLADDGVAGISVTNKLYNIDFSPEISFRGLAEDQLYSLIQTIPELRNHVANYYKISGYSQIAEQIVKNQKANAAILAEPEFVESEESDESDDESDDEAEEVTVEKKKTGRKTKSTSKAK